MPRAVPPWLHRVCIRRYGPKDPMQRLLLFVLNSYMDEAGECWPGQTELATAACMGVSTVRRKAAAASKAQWIGLYPRGMAGQRWRSYMYRAAVPDWIELADIPNADALADAFQAQYGEIEQGAVSGTLYPQKGKRRAPPVAGGSSRSQNTENGASTARSRQEHRPLTHEVPPADDEKHRPQRRGKSSSESSQEKLSVEGAALTRDTASLKTLGEEFLQGKKAEEPKPQRAVTRRDVLKLKAAGYTSDYSIAKHLRVAVADVEAAMLAEAS